MNDPNDSFSEEIEDKIHDYISGQMTANEKEIFEDLMDEDDNLFSHVMIHGMIIDSFTQKRAFKELEAACESRDYLKIRSLVRKLIESDYDERKFPVRQLIAPYMEHITGSEIEQEELDVLHEQFNTSHDKNEWERVIELGEELDKLGATEDVYPRKEKVDSSKKALRFISVILSDGEINLGVISEKVIVPLHSLGKVLIKRGSEMVKEFVINEDVIVGFADKDGDDVIKIFEDESLAIELLRTESEDRLLFTPKK